MKKLFWVLFCGFSLALAQTACKKNEAAKIALIPRTLYVFTEPSASLRELPASNGKEIVSIPFGKAVTLENLTQGKEETLDGKTGAWAKASYADKAGYVFTGFLSAVPMPLSACKSVVDYTKSALTREGKETRVYDDPAGKGPYHWTQKFTGNIGAEGYGSDTGGVITLQLPVHDAEIGFQICKRCTPFFQSLQFTSFKEQNMSIKQCSARSKQGGCLRIWTIETTATPNGLTVNCGAESM